MSTTRDPHATIDYVLDRECERLIGPDGKPTERADRTRPKVGAVTFILGVLPARHEDVVGAALMRASKSPEESLAALKEQSRFILAHGLRGWKGMTNNNGNAIDFKLDRGVCAEENMEALWAADRLELASKIIDFSGVQDSEGK